MILYGSNMSNSNLHNHYPLPTALVGGWKTVKGGQKSTEDGKDAEFVSADTQDKDQADDDGHEIQRHAAVLRRHADQGPGYQAPQNQRGERTQQ